MESQAKWAKYCQDHIIKKMRSDRYGNLFTNPVLEANDSMIPPSVKENYRLVIKQPMDYKTVKGKLESGAYAKPEEFFEDMKLIYDNCMRFNPPTGNSKWAHDAAVSNMKKFKKLWDSCSKVVFSLFQNAANASLELAPKGDTPAVPGSSDFTGSAMNSNGPNESDLGSASKNETSVSPFSASGPMGLFPEGSLDSGLDLQFNFTSETTPRNKWSFRLNLQSIQEYKLRKGFLNQVPEMTTFSNYLDNRMPVQPEISLDSQPTTMPYERYSPDVISSINGAMDVSFDVYETNTVDTPIEFEELETEPHTTLDMDVPQILSKNDDGVVCVSFLSDNECNRLFPNCSIIGLGPEKTNYNMSDVSIRYIYNQLYLNDIGNVNFDQKKELEPETMDLEDEYRLDADHDKVRINFNNFGTCNQGDYDGQQTLRHDPHAATRTNGSSFAKPRSDNTQLMFDYSKMDDSVFDNAETDDDYVEPNKTKVRAGLKKLVGKLIHRDPNKKPSDSDAPNTPDLNDPASTDLSNGHSPGSNASEATSTHSTYQGSLDDIVSARGEPLDLFIDIDSNWILNVGEAESLLERNLFSRVAVKGEFFNIYDKPQLALLCGNRGYFKLDESEFVFDEVSMKHIRIFFFNCSKTKVRVSCRRASFTELVLENRYNFSLVSNLLNEFKLGNVSHLPFFSLPNSTPIRFAKQQDILYRLQNIHNSLPVQLLALHIIATL